MECQAWNVLMFLVSNVHLSLGVIASWLMLVSAGGIAIEFDAVDELEAVRFLEPNSVGNEGSPIPFQLHCVKQALLGLQWSHTSGPSSMNSLRPMQLDLRHE